jgi:hypothetical protein
MTPPKERLADDAQMPAETVDAMERRLLEAFAAHHGANGHTDGEPRVSAAPDVPGAGRQWRRWVAVAAALVLAVGAVGAWRVLGTPGGKAETQAARALPASARAAERRPESAPIVDAVEERSTAARSARSKERPAAKPRVVPASGFLTLPSAAGLPEFESGTIVRVELAIASLPGYGVDISRAGRDGAVEADVLVGQDGQARAIRLVGQNSLSRSGQ